MIVIADISVSADQFPLGRILEAYPSVEIELERLVPLQDGIIPLFWVSDGDSAAIEETLRDDPLTNSVTRLTQTNSRVLFEVEWGPEVNGLVQALLRSDARLLAAEGTADIWDFRIQFDTRADMAHFRRLCTDAEISLTLRRLYNPMLPEESGALSNEQYEALVTAFRAGYFEVPRASKMSDLAAGFGVSDSAFSQRIRRGISSLIAETLMPEFGHRGQRADPVSWNVDTDNR
ncbi:helix-turn-helix domain-containing protein [Halomarina oriensis]|uniref:Bacterio-opsin activator n=1 Tax=Halomarina oriensis TaxID=671145 RepID=A0A6B0GH79_9EURY|nr:helix-turn-helix domain-containing protein [Halomarina oriensis]MWG34206.1 bacterio-opsin activator [Halomarina oriensis]